MQNRFLKSFTAIAMCGLMLALAAPSSAQIRIQFGRDRYSDAARVARTAESHTRQFEAMVYRSGERNDRDEDRYNGRYNDGFVDRARELETQLSGISQDLESGANPWDVRSQVATALRTAESINRGLSYQRTAFGFGVDRQWLLVRSDLNRLARMYNLRQL